MVALGIIADLDTRSLFGLPSKHVVHPLVLDELSPTMFLLISQSVRLW